MNPGPCVMCGAVNYSNSMGGPDICPSCDCGNPPSPNGGGFQGFGWADPLSNLRVSDLANIIVKNKFSKEDVLEAWNLAQVKSVQES